MTLSVQPAIALFDTARGEACAVAPVGVADPTFFAPITKTQREAGGVRGVTVNDAGQMVDAAGTVGGVPVGAEIDPVTGMVELSNGNSPYVPKPSIYNLHPYFLRNYLAALGKVRAGTGNAPIGYIGDSTAVGFGAETAMSWTGARAKSTSAQLAKMLNSYFVPARNDAWFGDGNVGNAALPLYDPRISFTSGHWAVQSGTSFLSVGHAPMKSSNTSALEFTPGNSWDKANIWFTSYSYSGNGSASVIAGASSSLATINCNTGSPLFNNQAVTAPSKAAQALKITPADTKNVIINGVECYDSTIPSVLIRNYGWSTATVSDWAETDSGGPYAPIPAAAAMSNCLTFINLTINDLAATARTPVATWSAKIQAFITALQTANSDVVLMMGNPTQAVGPDDALAQAYIAEIYRLAKLNGCVLIDLFTRWTSYAVSNPLGRYSDGTHGSGPGYADTAQAQYQVLTAF